MWSSLHSTTSSHGIISSTTIAISHYHAMLQSNVFAVWHSLTQISMIKRTTSYMNNININRYHLYENDNDNDNNDNDDEFIHKRRLSILMHPTSSLHKTVSMRDKIMHRLKQKNSPTSSASSSSSRSRSPNEDLTYMFTEDIEDAVDAVDEVDAVDAVDEVDAAKDIQDSQPYNVTSTGKKIILYLLNYFCFFCFFRSLTTLFLFFSLFFQIFNKRNAYLGYSYKKCANGGTA